MLINKVRCYESICLEFQTHLIDFLYNRCPKNMSLTCTLMHVKQEGQFTSVFAYWHSAFAYPWLFVSL